MRIFISYARQDQAAVEALNADLERARLQVWMDEELIGGESWWDTILEQIRSCDLYIFALSPNSLRSRACKAELDYAIALSRPLLPVLIREVAIQLAHPAIARTQMVDYRKRSMESLLALMAVVANRPPAPPLPNPLPAAPTTPMSYMNEFRELVDAPDLTYQKQAHLLLDLKGYLDRDEERGIALQLVRGLRQRRDISYSIAREIDQLPEFANDEDQSPTGKTAGTPHDEYRSDPEPTSQGLSQLEATPLDREEQSDLRRRPPTSLAATPSVDDRGPGLGTKAAPEPMVGQSSGVPKSAEAPPPTAEGGDVALSREAVAGELMREEPPPSHAPPESRSPPTEPARITGSPTSKSGSRRRVALILTAAAVVAGIFVVAAVDLWPTPSGAPTSADGSLSSTEASASGASSPPPTKTSVPPLPHSTPLTDTQLLVPALVDGTYDIYLGDVTKNAPVRALIKGPGNDTDVSLSPDRASMIYAHDGVLQVAAADGSGSRPLFSSVPKECAKSNTRPGWNSADPTQIVTACVDADGKHGVYLVTIDGKVIRKLSEADDDRVGDPGFSPDGKFVVFWANAGVLGNPGFDGGDIVVAAADGKGKPRRVTRMTNTVYDADPAWSPEGDQLAFRRRDRTGDLKNSDVYVIDADGKGEAKPLADDPQADEQNPSWSPSGDEMAYKSKAESAAFPGQTIDRVWVMNSNGDNQRVLWSSGGAQLGAQIAPSWSSR
jgi:Tol biopolymer transport system component